MITLIVTLVIIAAIFASGFFFLAKELAKKFGFMKVFTEKSNQLIDFEWYGAKLHKTTPGMRKIILFWNRPFVALVGFRLSLPGFGVGFDYYGQVEAQKGENGNYEVVIDTYCGNGACLFQFFVNHEIDGGLVVSSADWVQNKKAQAVYSPHWWQKLGFWG